MIKSYKISVNKNTLNKINSKVKSYPWNLIQNISGWEYGTNFNYLKSISKYWSSKYNWKKYEKKINSFSNYKTKIDRVNLHFIKEISNNPKSRPLLLLHGWPGSIIEFLDIIPKLAHPEKFGGKIEDGFDVIVPSLPGFGFSTPIKKAMGPREIGKVINKLMVKNLGYKKYAVQGGDWGATIAGWMGYDSSKNCKAIHINCLPLRHPNGPLNKKEKEWQIKFNKDQITEDGYRTQQATKPQTLSYAMADSPVGTAAWILEKFHGWSDLKKGNMQKTYSRDLLLTNIMIYILTKSVDTATWIYFGRRKEGGRLFPKNFKKIMTPTAIAEFPKEMLGWPPRSYVNRIFNVKRWSKFSRGGHFAALEAPDLLLNDIQTFLNKDLKLFV
jgi:microsomal epoxide hydrolase